MSLLGERIKELRKEKGWLQEELADKIGTDARQISRYENGRITPSTEAIVKLAEAFDVSIDYLLIDKAPRRSLRVSDLGLLNRLEEIQSLSDDDRSSLLRILDALVAKNKMKSLAENLR
jgi:transcriptional regulator with XRE-family HTH domain